MKQTRHLPARLVLLTVLAGVLHACGGGGGGGGGEGGFCPALTGNRVVALNWAPNHEAGVNRPGGGYLVAIGGQPSIRVPYLAGSAAPSSTLACLPPGRYVVTVQGYAALDAQGGHNGSISAPSQPLSVFVPPLRTGSAE